MDIYADGHVYKLLRQRTLNLGGESLTQQHFAEEVDINTIMRRFGATGQVAQFMSEGAYGDFTGIEDYDGALERIGRVDEAFMKLPAEVREQFGNDAGNLVRMAQAVSEDELGAILFPVEPSAESSAPAAG